MAEEQWTCRCCEKVISKNSILLHLRSKTCRKYYTDEEYKEYQIEVKTLRDAVKRIKNKNYYSKNAENIRKRIATTHIESIESKKKKIDQVQLNRTVKRRSTLEG